ncbi:MAG: peptidylprolyl isomerase [Blastocatellia bacterium]|nr:peptidylprolyl isomerase [Blastocatellia bacterium]
MVQPKTSFRRRFRNVAFFCLLACGLLNGCKTPTTAPTPAGGESPIVATVNGKSLTKAAFETYMAVRTGTLQADGLSAKVKSQMLDEFIEREIKVEAALQRGLKPAETTQPVPSAGAVGETTIPPAMREQEQKADALSKSFDQTAASNIQLASKEDVNKFYEANKTDFERNGFYVREIRVESDALIQEIAQKLKSNTASFVELARKHSQSPNARHGGLNYYDRGQLPPELEEPVLALRPGEISKVLHTSFGYHIFKLERMAEPLPFESVRDDIQDKVTQARQQESVEKETKRVVSEAKVEIREAVLGFPYEGKFKR